MLNSLVATALRLPILTRRTLPTLAPAGARNVTVIPRPRTWRRRHLCATRSAVAAVGALTTGAGACTTIGAGAGAWMTTGAGAGNATGVPVPFSATVCGAPTELLASASVAL